MRSIPQMMWVRMLKIDGKKSNFDHCIIGIASGFNRTKTLIQNYAQKSKYHYFGTNEVTILHAIQRYVTEIAIGR